jgi:hypothetical protein
MHYAIKTRDAVHVQLHIFLTSALDGGEWSASRPGRCTPGKRAPRYPFDRKLGGPQNRAGRHGEEKSPTPTGTRTSTLRLFIPQPVAILTAVYDLFPYLISQAQLECFISYGHQTES